MKKIIIIALSFVLALIIGIFVINVSEKETDVTEETTRVGLILNGPRNDGSWSQSHYEALCATAKEINLQIICKENISAENASDVIRELVMSDCKVIVANSAIFGDAVTCAAKAYPEIYFFHASGTNFDKNLCTYFGRMYQIRYLTGIVAGLTTETNEIGYVAAMPVSEVNRGLNAFTLGVRKVNPDAKVYVRWTDSWSDNEAAAKASEQLIKEHNIDILAMHTDSLEPLRVADENNIYSIGYNLENKEKFPDSYLTAAVWDWKQFYTPQILRCLQGKFEGKNHWAGLETGMINIADISPMINPKAKEKAMEEYEKMKNGTFDVFYGPVYDNEGNLRIAEGESMTDNAMLNDFDWYVEGVYVDE
ncbi:MAG: BMP family ABC transporter substrate-binding protein [Oscillospiraceae bacterium]|nr:BMP family ABC transporter substrate-binding protein [Oscillospiraceae bacterium]